MPTATIHQAKTNLSKLIEQAERGKEVLIARGKKVMTTPRRMVLTSNCG